MMRPRNIQQEFTPLQIDEATLNTIRDFFKQLEAHDQRVFMARSKDGIALPATREEHRLMYRNLACVTHEYRVYYGFDTRQCREAIDWYKRSKLYLEDMREVFIDPRSKDFQPPQE